MNTNGLNTAPLNGSSGVTGMVVEMGPASTGFAFIVFDRDASPMSGSTGFAFESYGNLSNIVQIGDADTGFNFGIDGNLIDDDRVFFDAVSTGFSIDIEAVLSLKPTMGTSVTGFTFAVTGVANRRKLMAGSSGFNMAVNGVLTSYVKQYLPASTATMQFDVSGTLFSYVNMGAAPTGVTFDVQGILSTRIYISGATGFSFAVTGSLFNNPQAPDLDSYTLIRPYINRIMVRRS